jgi:hypothetical protein
MGLLAALDYHKQFQLKKDDTEIEYRLYSWGEIHHLSYSVPLLHTMTHCRRSSS